MFFRSVSRRSSQQRKSLSQHARRHRRRTFSSRNSTLEALEQRQVLATFAPMGPAAIVHGQVEKIQPNNEVSGAIHTVLTHPTNPNVMYIGAANGGIWKTTNATATSPSWTPLTDDLPSLSIGAMAMDPGNPQRIVAGYARYSSLAEGGALAGLILTEDGGAHWTVIDDPLLVGKNISGVIIQDDLIIATAGGGNYVQDPEPERGGIFRSTDGGQTWENIEILSRDPNFPDEPVDFKVFDLVADPTNPDRFYASVANTGIFRSDDGGENWTDATAGNARVTQLLGIIANNNLENNNIEMAVANNGRIYMAVITVGQPLFIAYSDSFGGNWIEMDVPLTLETTGVVGVSPNPKPGGQGNIHFSIVADPNDPYTVYLAGDRQDGDLSFMTGNSIGARDFTGKLFRGDTRKDSIGNVLNLAGFIPFNGYSPQWEHLTHSNLIPEMPQGGTRRGSAPHADSREMTFDANGDLIEVDDGGIYRRTLPQSNQGDWYSLNGNLQVTEIHDVAYDSISNILVGGTQDNGTIQQMSPNSKVWESVPLQNQSIVGNIFRRSVADGGDVAIDDSDPSGISYRYLSIQFLGFFRRQAYNAQNQLIAEEILQPNIIGQFVTPVVINSARSGGIAIGGGFGIFESFDRGNSFREILGPESVSFGVLGLTQTAMVAGGVKNGVSNPSLLYVGTGNEVFVRTRQQDNMRITRAQYPGGRVQDLDIDSTDWANVYVIDQDDVYVSFDEGDSWRKVTGNLHAVGGGNLRSIEFVRESSKAGYLVVGTTTGVYVTSDSNPGKWTELGNVPNAPVSEIEFDPKDDVLAVGTMGRGAFLLRNAYDAVSGQSTAAGINRTASGSIWNDLDGDGVREAGEPGMGGVTVYADLNGNNQFNVSEPAVVANPNGTYTLHAIPAGTYAIRTQLQPGWTQTAPASGEHVVNFTTTTQATNLNFGIQEGRGNDMGFDFGDAPAPFPTLLSDQGASHGIVPGFHLGPAVDGDLNGRPTPFAGGDDNSNIDDEDGVAFVSDLIPGSTATIQITISNGTQPGGVVQGWIDFDGDGAWTTPGEQILRDRTLPEGLNTISINVPAWAVEGFTFARFRYGYERGISFTGRAVAGEVEDYRIEVTKGGPTAVNDQYVVRRNSANNQMSVLTNDDIRPGSDTRITAVSAPSAGGAVAIAGNGGSLFYTPVAGYTGNESFTYTITDRNGLADSATVSVYVQPDLASIRLLTTTPDGTPISSVNVGDTFQLRGIVQDLSPPGSGVFAAYLDVEYPEDAVSVASGITYGVDFPNGQSGSTSTPGLIDEVGGFDGLDRIGSGEALLFTITMQADSAGTVEFTTNPPDVLPQHNILLFDRDEPVPFNQIEFATKSITIVQPIVSNTNPRNALDVNDDTSISPLDALLVINELNRANSGALDARAEGEDAPMYLDVSADGSVSPLDALLIINELNRMSSTSAEGEQDPRVAAAVAAIPEASADVSSPVTVSRDSDEPVVLIGPADLELQQQAKIFADDAFAALDGVDDEKLNQIVSLLDDDLVQRLS